ncbi:hypothetical protein GUITHDRAFT_91156 [Guillardia theta CCMP2712]|uniref:Dynein light chain Tctex-type 1 n=2 Tax=Guillardia theta TaxID=55529 RepID=L1I699_GUITC|nr:hypothetical protein GUITHDRAFT_91156 [Guillardia theta CCMP2712]EKX31768.1 hypothetical protein GUITHDRAFT_91156 [Guillardia theta CCMP2712]|eukprot:XP_005818748.1 hypothetical protein GUITHDRAFT_91156 [Guillardia theta CCMP2712]
MTRHHSSVVSIFDIGLQTAFDKDQIKTILKECVEETLGQHTYEHSKIGQWINDICEKSTKRLIALSKPFKYVVTCVIVQRNGAGLHTAASCFWDSANDGSASFRWEEKTMYCVAKCFALAI